MNIANIANKATVIALINTPDGGVETPPIATAPAPVTSFATQSQAIADNVNTVNAASAALPVGNVATSIINASGGDGNPNVVPPKIVFTPVFNPVKPPVKGNLTIGTISNQVNTAENGGIGIKTEPAVKATTSTAASTDIKTDSKMPVWGWYAVGVVAIIVLIKIFK